MKHLSKLIKDAKTLLNYIEEEIAVIPLMNRLTKSQEEVDTANRLYHPYETMLREMLNTYSNRHNVMMELLIFSKSYHNCYTEADVIISYNNKYVLREINHGTNNYDILVIEYCCKKLLQAISHEGLDYYIKKKLIDLNIK